MPYNYQSETTDIVTDNIIPTVNQVLNLLGDNTTFTRIIPGAFDPSTGCVATGSTLSFTCKGISDKFNTQELQDETIQYGDMKYIILPTDGNVPAVNDTCVINGISYRIMSVLNDNLQGSTYLYTLQLRV
jgi:hypothetical protein